MELASITFHQILVMFVLMVIGYICAKTRLIDEATNKRLSSIVMMLVNPLVIFLSFQREFDPALLRGLFISFGLSALSYVISLTVTHLVYRNRPGVSYPIEQFGCVYSNSGFIGIPLVKGVFGLEGVFYLTAYLALFNLLIWTHGVIVMTGKADFRSIRKALVSPPLIATFLGLIAFLARFQLPEILAEPFELVGATNPPLAMIVAGVSMAQLQLLSMFTSAKIYRVMALRLVIIPLLVIAAFSWLDLPTILTGVVIIVTACPVGANIILFAYRYNQDQQYASRLFSSTTLVSLITLPLIMLLI